MQNQPISANISSSQIRTWTRFPAESPGTWVTVAGENLHAMIVDDSFGGIGVTIEVGNVVRVKPGDWIVVFHCDYATPGQVRWLQHNEETNRIRLGIYWTT
jgi:hypothetical protein